MLTKSIYTLLIAILSCLTLLPAVAENQHVKPSPNGLSLPDNYKDWRIISQSHRIDNQTVRIILGNDIAIKAARSSNTNPWPKGTILAKLVWKEKPEEFWPAAIAPDKFIHAEFMFKDDNKFKSTGGWGYARWLGLDQLPYGKNEKFAQECVTCHLPVKDRDYVFTSPVKLP